jgi:DNA primase
MIKTETVEQVRLGTDIVELVGGYLPLKKVGRNYRGLCPFHTERSPSFYVNPERQSYHCFGCGAGGSAFNFVMAQERLEFPEAVRFLARRLNITIEEEQGSGRNQALYDACERAVGFFEQQLARTSDAQAYLARRGIGAETARRFRLGFAAGGNRLRGTAGRQGLSEDVLVRAGLLARRDSGPADYFYNRLMFPIFSLSGKVIGFGGRVLDDGEPKYLNSPDSEIFRKGENLYGLFQAKGYLRDGVPLLVEGNFDLLSLVEKGLNGVVAPLGTALTPAQARLLLRYNRRLTVCFDGDAAGRKAARRAVATLVAAGIDPRVVVLPDGADPDSFVRERGVDQLLVLVEGGADIVDFVAAGRESASVPEQRAALGELAGLLRVMPDLAARELYANRVADRFRVSKAVLLREVAQEQQVRHPASPPSPARRAIEEKLVGAVVQSAELARQARDHTFSEVVADPELQPLAKMAEESCDEPGFGAGQMMDRLEDEAARRLVAALTFTVGVIPTVDEFRERVCRLRAEWLHRRIVDAEQRGESELAEALRNERHRLLQDVVRERSSRR